MEKPNKPRSIENKVYPLVYSYTRNMGESFFLPKEEVEAYNNTAVDEEGDATDDKLWDAESVSLATLKSAVEALPEGYEWKLVARSLERDSCSVAFEGVRNRSAEELATAQAKYETDLKAYEKWKKNEKREKQARVLENKRKQLEALKKELGDE